MMSIPMIHFWKCWIRSITTLSYKEKIPLPLTMIVGKGSVVCVPFLSTVGPTVPIGGIATCQLHMRRFNDGDIIYVEPFRARAFPVIKDLVVDRSAFDRIQQAGGYISVNTSGNPQDANTIPIEKTVSDEAFDAATCIGCGAC